MEISAYFVLRKFFFYRIARSLNESRAKKSRSLTLIAMALNKVPDVTVR